MYLILVLSLFNQNIAKVKNLLRFSFMWRNGMSIYWMVESRICWKWTYLSILGTPFCYCCFWHSQPFFYVKCSKFCGWLDTCFQFVVLASSSSFQRHCWYFPISDTNIRVSTTSIQNNSLRHYFLLQTNLYFIESINY